MIECKFFSLSPRERGERAGVRGAEDKATPTLTLSPRRGEGFFKTDTEAFKPGGNMPYSQCADCLPGAQHAVPLRKVFGALGMTGPGAAGRARKCRVGLACHLKGKHSRAA
jgi:hypothetical protein